MTKSVCIVIPCFNEELRLNPDAFTTYLQAHSNVSFCFSNDGSTDNTLNVLSQIQQSAPERVNIHSLAINQGKGEAVRQGILAASSWKTFDWIGFWDADLSAPLSELGHFLKMIEEKENLKIIFGSRVGHFGALVKRNIWRHYLGRVFSTVASMLLSLPIYDTQCGAKLFSAPLAKKLMSEPFVSKWVFDVEIFARIVNIYGAENLQHIMWEAPLRQWSEVKGSKLKFKHFIKAPIDLIKIYFTYISKTHNPNK